jgi:hypothetical protein
MTNSGDLISRQAAIDALGDEPEVWSGKDEYEQGLNNQWHHDVNALKALPSAQPFVIHCTDCEDWYKKQSVWNVAISELTSTQPDKAQLLQEDATLDCISRQAAIDAVEHITSTMSVCVNTDECHGMKRMQRQAVIELTNLPSAQPEPDIIACGDCKHWICHDKRCGYWNHGVKPLDWCCHGERRADG